MEGTRDTEDTAVQPRVEAQEDQEQVPEDRPSSWKAAGESSLP